MSHSKVWPVHKLSYLVGAEWMEHSFAPLFHQPSHPEGQPLLIAGVPHSDPAVFKRMLGLLEPPYFLLYVLHTPRGEGKAGRYQSPALSLEQMHKFIDAYAPLLSGDARFDLWGHSAGDTATVVWDRHNKLFAYGPVERFATELHSLGFQSGDPIIPGPHSHHYHPEFDGLAAALLKEFDWSYSPLRPEDEQ